MNTTQIYEIPLSEIQLGGINVRTDLNSANSKASLQELADSIKNNGLMQPIVLKGVYQQNTPYDVVVGQRRFLAHQLLGLASIKATFTGPISDLDALVLSLSENLLRQELNHSDTMEAVTKLYQAYGNDERKVKEKLGLSIKAIRSYIKVDAQATPKIKALLSTNQLSLMDAKRVILASQGDAEKADIFVDSILQMTKYEKIRAVEFGQNNPNASAKEIIDKAQTPKIEETLILNLPLKVSKALKKASEALSRESEEIIMDALTNWLKSNDYLMV